jgi:outer membrane cobalamin receptor
LSAAEWQTPGVLDRAYAGRFAVDSAAEWLGGSVVADVQTRGPLGVQGEVALRGATFSQTLILLDGLPLSDAQTAHHNLDLPVNADDLEQVDVLPGPGSARYGSEAFGGVVALVTRPPGEGRATLGAWGGSYGTAGARLRVPWVLGSWAQTVSAERVYSAGFRPDTDADLTQAGYALSWRDGALAWTGRVGYADKRFGAQDFYGPYPSREHTRLEYVSGSLRAPLSASVKAAPALAFRRHEDDFTLDQRDPDRTLYQHRTWSLDADLPVVLAATDGGTLRTGLEIHPERLDSSNLGSHERLRAAAYVWLQSPAAQRWHYAFGLRADNAGGGVWQGSPSLALAYRAAAAWRLRASAGRAFRLPSFTELYYRSPSNQGNPLLQAEQAWSYEAGVDWQPEALTAGVTFFRRLETNGIDWVRPAASAPWEAVNLRTVNAYGCEAQLDWRWRDWTLAAGAVWQTVTADVPPVQSKYQLNYPAQRFLMAVTWQAGAVTPGVRAAYTRRPEKDGFWFLDGVLTYRWMPGWSVYAKMTNALNVAYEEIPGVPLPGRWLWAGAAVEF